MIWVPIGDHYRSVGYTLNVLVRLFQLLAEISQDLAMLAKNDHHLLFTNRYDENNIIQDVAIMPIALKIASLKSVIGISTESNWI